MVFSAEIVLIAAMIGLYLYDSAQLLFCNEAVLVPAGKNGWAVGFGSGRLCIRGKELYIPNPLRIHQPQFRLSWEFERDKEPSGQWQPLRRALSPLTPLVWIMAIALFVFFPLGFFTRLGDLWLLLALAALFSSILVALTWLWFHRKELQLSGKRFAGLAFESLVCPPFALNLIRHVTMAMPVEEDLASAARRLQSRANWQQTRGQMIARLTSEIECADDESERYALLHARRQSLIDEGDTCQG